jgi:hypothetical protein
MTAAVCAAPGCGKPVPPRRPGAIGRPPIYCSVACRPSTSHHAQLVVDVNADDTGDPVPGRDWMVRLRRGRRSVVVVRGLGWLSANALAANLRQFLSPQEEGGDTID